MTNREAATRYARALLEVSQKEDDPERIEREVADFVDLMAAHPDLGRGLLSPGVPPTRKRALMAALVPELGDLSEVTGRLLVMLADRDRVALLVEILAAYRDQLRQRQGVLRARITTTSELPAARVDAIAQSLRSATGKTVQVETAVDSTLLGGMVTQVGSTVYDGSVSGHIDRLRRMFLS